MRGLAYNLRGMLINERGANVRPTMKFAAMLCAGVLMFSEGATAQEGGKAISNSTISSSTISNATISRTAISSTTISLGTATPGGGFPLYGNAFADIINAADPTLAVEPRNTKGSNENIPSWKQASSTSQQ
jgi:TRAP-type uncharacterized transport system substrate-binding protein